MRGAAPDGADLLIVQGGINDIAQGASIEDAAGQPARHGRRRPRRGPRVAITDVLPWNNGHPAADQPIAELNAEIAGSPSEEGVPLLPFHDTLESPSEPGTMKPEWTIDGDHPSVEGYRLLAEQVAVQSPRDTAQEFVTFCPKRGQN